MNPTSRSKRIRSSGVQAAVLLSATFLFFVLPARSQVQMPEGNGKAIVEKACTECHGLDRVTRPAGNDREGWQDTINFMVSQGAKLAKDQISVVVDYLAKNFPDRSPKPAVIPGGVEVSIKEWTVPTPGSDPHDPLVAPDGSIWYTGIGANLLGRFDPQTEKFKEYRLKTANSGPHGLVADKEGNIWFTAQSGSYVGKLDPKTGDVTEYKMPDSKARDPHTPIMDHNGTLWFTLQGASMVGRLIPKTGKVKVVPTPTPRVQPYGMVVSSKNVVYFAELGTNKLASIDSDPWRFMNMFCRIRRPVLAASR